MKYCVDCEVSQEPKSIRFLPATNPESFVRSGLARYGNVSAIKRRLIDRFKIPKGHHDNAEKQAAQLSFCLRQAQEYLDAASDRTLATRPVLLYYASVSLALAEILWKGRGDHSLEKLRAHHGNHGFDFVAENVPVTEQAGGARLLRARMRGPVGQRSGTFGVWHRFARNQQLVGIETQRYLSGQGVEAPQILLMPDNVQSRELPEEGISLLECVMRMPTLVEYLPQLGLSSQLLRSTISRTATERKIGIVDYDLRVEVHPNSHKLIAAFKEQVRADANLVDAIYATDFPNSLSLRLRTSTEWNYLRVGFPEGYSMSLTETWFSGASEPLNEFGYFYSSLYICGMFARYYPDVWMRHLAASTGLALLIDAVCITAQDRLPLLSLDELDHAITLPKRMS